MRIYSTIFHYVRLDEWSLKVKIESWVLMMMGMHEFLWNTNLTGSKVCRVLCCVGKKRNFLWEIFKGEFSRPVVKRVLLSFRVVEWDFFFFRVLIVYLIFFSPCTQRWRLYRGKSKCIYSNALYQGNVDGKNGFIIVVVNNINVWCDRLDLQGARGTL